MKPNSRLATAIAAQLPRDMVDLATAISRLPIEHRLANRSRIYVAKLIDNHWSVAGGARGLRELAPGSRDD